MHSPSPGPDDDLDGLPPRPVEPAENRRPLRFTLVGATAETLAAVILLVQLWSLLIFARAFGHVEWTRLFPPSAVLGMVSVQGVAVAGLVVQVWLGHGLLRCRRWARRLLLAWGWGSLAFGLPGFVSSLLRSAGASWASAPGELLSDLDPSGAWVRILHPAILLLLAVLPPALVVLALRGGDSRRICEARDPQRSWTERLPLADLATALWAGLAGVERVIGSAWAAPLVDQATFRWLAASMAGGIVLAAGAWNWLRGRAIGRRLVLAVAVSDLLALGLAAATGSTGSWTLLFSKALQPIGLYEPGWDFLLLRPVLAVLWLAALSLPRTRDRLTASE